MGKTRNTSLDIMCDLKHIKNYELRRDGMGGEIATIFLNDGSRIAFSTLNPMGLESIIVGTPSGKVGEENDKNTKHIPCS